MQQSSSLKKVITISGLLAAIFAVTTPFWLFSSEQSVTQLNKGKQTQDTISNSNAASTTPSSTNKPQSTPNQAADTATTQSKGTSNNEVKAQNSTNKAKHEDNSSPAIKPSDANKQSQERNEQRQDVSNEAKADASSDIKKLSDSKDKINGADEDKGAIAKSDDVKGQSKRETAKVNDVTADDKGEAAKNSAEVTADNKDKASNNTTEGTKNKDVAKDKEAQAIADAKKQATGSDNFATEAVEQSDLSETTLNEGTSITANPQSLTQKRTAEDRSAYERAIKEREMQVDEAIASISGNYKVYLPSMLGQKAVVIYFSAPVSSTKINFRKDADLSKLPIDSLSGATVVKYQDQNTFEDVQKPAVDYIASTLSKESGAELYKISTVTTYPDNAAKLYSMSFTELAERKYPELTDDEPLSIDDYSTIYLCYPNWWGNMPGAIYSFLAKYDLSDKTIVPVCIYEKDKFSLTVETIATTEPNATVYHKGLLIAKDEFASEAKLRNKIRTFLTNLSKDFE